MVNYTTKSVHRICCVGQTALSKGNKVELDSYTRLPVGDYLFLFYDVNDATVSWTGELKILVAAFNFIPRKIGLRTTRRRQTHNTVSPVTASTILVVLPHSIPLKTPGNQYDNHFFPRREKWSGSLYHRP